MMDKQLLRRQFRQARLALCPTQRKQAESHIIRRLKPLIKRRQKIALYWAVGSELRLHGLLKTAHQRQATVYLPYIERGKLRLWFTPYTPHLSAERTKKGRLDIPQFAGNKIRAERLNVLLLPLVAMDKQGYRLGQGGGFYDASLAHARYGTPRKIGVGFACQLTEQLPHEAHDQPLDGFVSEQHYLFWVHKTA